MVGPILGTNSNDASWFVSSRTHVSEEASSRGSGGRGMRLGGHKVFLSLHISSVSMTKVMMMAGTYMPTVHVC